MNRFKFPVVQVFPTGSVIVAEHVTYANAQDDAALRDLVSADPATYHVAERPDSLADQPRQ